MRTSNWKQTTCIYVHVMLVHFITRSLSQASFFQLCIYFYFTDTVTPHGQKVTLSYSTKSTIAISVYVTNIKDIIVVTNMTSSLR